MAALVGIDWPVNSVGVFPDVDPTRPGYLRLKEGNKGKAKLGLINAKVILEQYRIKDGLSNLFFPKIDITAQHFCSLFEQNSNENMPYFTLLSHY